MKIASVVGAVCQSVQSISDQLIRSTGIEIRDASGNTMGSVLRPSAASPGASQKSEAWMVVNMIKELATIATIDR